MTSTGNDPKNSNKTFGAINCTVTKTMGNGPQYRTRHPFPSKRPSAVYHSRCSSFKSDELLSQRSILLENCAVEDAGKKNKINIKSNASLNNCKFRFRGFNNSINIESGSITNCSFIFYGKNNKLIIGKNIKLKDTFFLFYGEDNTITLSDEIAASNATVFQINGRYSSITIGPHTILSDSSFFTQHNNGDIKVDRASTLDNAILFSQDFSSVTVKKGSKLHNCLLMTASHQATKEHMISIMDSYLPFPFPIADSITIGEYSKIDKDTIFFGGTDIPDHSVIEEEYDPVSASNKCLETRQTRLKSRARNSQKFEDLWLFNGLLPVYEQEDDTVEEEDNLDQYQDKDKEPEPADFMAEDTIIDIFKDHEEMGKFDYNNRKRTLENENIFNDKMQYFCSQIYKGFSDDSYFLQNREQPAPNFPYGKEKYTPEKVIATIKQKLQESQQPKPAKPAAAKKFTDNVQRPGPASSDPVENSKSPTNNSGFIQEPIDYLNTIYVTGAKALRDPNVLGAVGISIDEYKFLDRGSHNILRAAFLAQMLQCFFNFCGSNNYIEVEGSDITDFSVQIFGSGNSIFTGRKTNMRHCCVTIMGSNNVLKIHNNATLDDVFIEIEGEGCEISIGSSEINESFLLIRNGKCSKISIGYVNTINNSIIYSSSQCHLEIGQCNYIGDSVIQTAFHQGTLEEIKESVFNNYDSSDRSLSLCLGDNNHLVMCNLSGDDSRSKLELDKNPSDKIKNTWLKTYGIDLSKLQGVSSEIISKIILKKTQKRINCCKYQKNLFSQRVNYYNQLNGLNGAGNE